MITYEEAKHLKGKFIQDTTENLKLGLCISTKEDKEPRQIKVKILRLQNINMKHHGVPGTIETWTMDKEIITWHDQGWDDTIIIK